MEPIKRPRAQFAEQDLPEEERESSFENCAINTLLQTLQAFCSCCLRRLAGCRTKPLPRCEKQTKCKKSHHRSSCFFWTRKLCWRTRAPYNDYIFAARISSPFSSSFFWQLFVALVVEAVVINKEKPKKLQKYSILIFTAQFSSAMSIKFASYLIFVETRPKIWFRLRSLHQSIVLRFNLICAHWFFKVQEIQFTIFIVKSDVSDYDLYCAHCTNWSFKLRHNPYLSLCTCVCVSWQAHGPGPDNDSKVHVALYRGAFGRSHGKERGNRVTQSQFVNGWKNHTFGSSGYSWSALNHTWWAA